MAYFFWFALIAFLSSVILTFIVKRGAQKFNIVDQPDGDRKIHQRPIPLLGGLAIFLAYFIVIFSGRSYLVSGQLEYSHWLGVFIGALIIIVGGFLDDKYNLRPRYQIIFPLLAVAAVILGGVSIAKISNPFASVWTIGSALSAVLISGWLLGMMYTTKLLDGVDGLVSGLTFIGAVVIFLFTLSSKYYQPDIAFASAVLAAVILGFLVFNFHPAKIFLGEGGSLFLGYILGVLAIISGGKIAIALLVMGIPILDVFWTIIRRLAAGKNPFRFSDRKHLHHRLLGLGLSQKQTVLIFYFFSALFGISALFLQSQGKFLALLAVLSLMLLAVIFFSRFKPDVNLSKKTKLLLHICCAPCGAYVSRDILAPQYDLTLYFYNSNLNTQEEYDKRLQAVKDLAAQYQWPLIVEPYNHLTWQQSVSGREQDAEKGPRCQVCIVDRLDKTAALAKKLGFTIFSTTLLVSPYKDSNFIRHQGGATAKRWGVDFLAADFQASGAYSKSQALAKELGFYRQKFCGCEYSLRK